MATQKDTSPQAGGAKKFIFASIGVSLLGLLFGFFIAAVLLPVETGTPETKIEASNEKAAEPNAHGAEEKAVADGEGNAIGEEAPQGPVSIVKMEPIVTNLSDSAEVWVRLEASMLFNGENVENRELLAAKISQHVLAYLRTLKLADLQGNGAVNAIVQDLNEITNTLSDGQAHGVLISGLVFE